MEPQIQGPVFLIEVDKIKPNPQQPRRDFEEEKLRELANSIREFGVLQPIVVSKLESDTEIGTQVEYQLIAGERRWLASKMVGLERVPAIIRNVLLDKERLELAIVENVQRADLNPIDAARAYSKLQDQFGLTQREIASRIGKSRETVSNTVRLLNLPNEMQDALIHSIISESQARLLLSVTDLASQQSLFKELIGNNLSVRELRSKIRSIHGEDKKDSLEPKDPIVSPDPETLSYKRALEEILGAEVQVHKSGETGKITISFNSQEELRGILDKILEKNNQSPPSSDSSPDLSSFTV